jgi:hypothetical protein
VVTSIAWIGPDFRHIQGTHFKHDLHHSLLFAESGGAGPFSLGKEWRDESDCLCPPTKHLVRHVEEKAAVHPTGKGDEHAVEVAHNVSQFIEGLLHR